MFGGGKGMFGGRLGGMFGPGPPRPMNGGMGSGGMPVERGVSGRG